jgi:NAD(P)H-hydrate epimerase
MIIPSMQTDIREAAALLMPRGKDVHKGDMGHAALLAGSWGMLGAAILSARGCLRCGAGKLTIFSEPASYPVLQQSIPEAIFQIADFGEWRIRLAERHYNAVAYGPGIGWPDDHLDMLGALFNCGCPLVIDADGLNQLARSKQILLSKLPPLTILTPHAEEYRRLFAGMDDPAEVARCYGIILVMKGRNSRVIGPDGTIYINMSGNPGMATAGSGDVLTGMILGILARGYDPLSAARLGVFLHGRAGDLASDHFGEESMMAGDLPTFIGQAYKELTDTLK